MWSRVSPHPARRTPTVHPTPGKPTNTQLAPRYNTHLTLLNAKSMPLCTRKFASLSVIPPVRSHQVPTPRPLGVFRKGKGA
jgi:hypothetical protein